MPEASERARRTLDAADAIHRLLHEHGVEAALIGALACAVHHYPRATRDADLAVYADATLKLPELVRSLQARGYDADYRRPDAEDPLGGVITVTAVGIDPVQIVNFCNPFSSADNPGWAAIQTARPVGPDRSMRVVDLLHLIALKLYAGGAKSRLDVVELLERNAALDLTALRELCARYRLEQDLDRLLLEIGLR